MRCPCDVNISALSFKTYITQTAQETKHNAREYCKIQPQVISSSMLPKSWNGHIFTDQPDAGFMPLSTMAAQPYMPARLPRSDMTMPVSLDGG